MVNVADNLIISWVGSFYQISVPRVGPWVPRGSVLLCKEVYKLKRNFITALS